jgi:FMN-dependent NADH-azoreductase
VVVVQTSGSGPEALAGLGMDHHTTYLRGFFGFLGIEDVEVVAQWGAVPEVADRTLAAAQERLREIAELPVDGGAAQRRAG